MASSLASLVQNAKANTARNALVQKTFAKRKNVDTKESSLKKAKPDTRSSSGDSKVIVFDDRGLRREPDLESRAAKKAFMSGNIWNQMADSEKSKKPTDEELEEEAENVRHDQELKTLLATSRLLEEYHMEEMTGKERRSKMMSKLEELGAKPSSKAKMPLEMHMGIEAKNRERAARRLQKAKESGMHDKSVNHLYVSAKKPVKRDRDPGITNGIGRMKGGLLTIGKHELTRIQNQGKKSTSKGGKKPKGKKR